MVVCAVLRSKFNYLLLSYRQVENQTRQIADIKAQMKLVIFFLVLIFIACLLYSDQWKEF
jgi:hypothetical protein